MVIVGIDPGVHTGVALWDTSERRLLVVTCCGIVEAMEMLHAFHVSRRISIVSIEDARQRRWIPRERDYRQIKGRAMGAGSVKRDCSVWEEWCRYHGIEFNPIPPRNNRTKLTALQFAGITGYDGRTNEHGRDAAMLVYGI